MTTTRLCKVKWNFSYATTRGRLGGKETFNTHRRTPNDRGPHKE